MQRKEKERKGGRGRGEGQMRRGMGGWDCVAARPLPPKKTKILPTPLDHSVAF